MRKPDLALLLLRLAGGGLMLTHGWSKFNMLLSGNFSFADPIGVGPIVTLVLAVSAEFLCSIALVVGFKTRWVAIPLLITMLVAVLIVHWSDPIGKKELGLLYSAIYAALAIYGGGRYSIDGKFAGK